MIIKILLLDFFLRVPVIKAYFLRKLVFIKKLQFNNLQNQDPMELNSSDNFL
jgi:hypothetical protein